MKDARYREMCAYEKEQTGSWLPLITMGWLVLNLIQASFTELFHDEAYYWTWSLFPAWGYAEHPPMIAWSIWLGRQIFEGELGVRLIPVFLGTGTFYLVVRMLGLQRPLDQILLLGGVVGMQIVGFLAVPDSPYVFFVTLFLWQYRKFLQDDSWRNALMLALVIAGMLYSKYHGMMVLGMVLLSNLKLLEQKKFWAIIGMVAVLLIPLLHWLIDQEFATFRFHLGSRVLKDSDWTFFTNYLGGQIGITGPLLGLLILPAAFLIKPLDQFERSLKFIVVGVLAFLFLMNFRTWVEANWSAGALVPAIILAGRQVGGFPAWKKWLIRLGWPSLVLMLVFRLYLMVDFITPIAGGSVFKDEFHGWDEWALEVQQKADGHPVLFYRSYQYPSKYWFYAGERAYTVPGFFYHRSQYHYFGQEEIEGKDVFFISSSPLPGLNDSWEADMVRRSYYTGMMEDFHGFSQVEIAFEGPDPMIKSGRLGLSVNVNNPYPTPIGGDGTDLTLGLHIHQNGRWKVHQQVLTALPVVPEKGSRVVPIHYDLDLPPGEYKIRVSLLKGPYCFGSYTKWTAFEAE